MITDHPFDDLVKEVINGLGFGTKRPGVAVILAPKGLGKSTHTKEVLKSSDAYDGFIFWSIDPETPETHFS